MFEPEQVINPYDEPQPAERGLQCKSSFLTHLFQLLESGREGKTKAVILLNNLLLPSLLTHIRALIKQARKQSSTKITGGWKEKITRFIKPGAAVGGGGSRQRAWMGWKDPVECEADVCGLVTRTVMGGH